MLQSIIVYSFQIMVISLLGIIANIRNHKKIGNDNKFWSWEVIIIFFIFTFFAAFRYDVGVDYLSYLSTYMKGYSEHLNFINETEPLFAGYISLLQYFSIPFYVFFAIPAFIQIFLVYYSFKNDKYLYPYLGFVLICLNYFSFMGGIRQSIVCCLFIYSIKFIKEHRLIPYILTIIIGSYIHKSALILIPIYFIFRFPIDFFKNRIFVICLIIAAMMLGRLDIWVNYIDKTQNIINFLGYEQYSSMIENNLDSFILDLSFGVRYYFPLFISLIAVIYSKGIKRMFNNSGINIYFSLYIIGVIFGSVFYNAGFIKRFTMYFTYFNIVGISFLLSYLWSRKNNNIIYIISFIIVILMCLIVLFAFIRSDFSTYYKFIWDLISY